MLGYGVGEHCFWVVIEVSLFGLCNVLHCSTEQFSCDFSGVLDYSRQLFDSIGNVVPDSIVVHMRLPTLYRYDGSGMTSFPLIIFLSVLPGVNTLIIFLSVLPGVNTGGVVWILKVV